MGCNIHNGYHIGFGCFCGNIVYNQYKTSYILWISLICDTGIKFALIAQINLYDSFTISGLMSTKQKIDWYFKVTKYFFVDQF